MFCISGTAWDGHMIIFKNIVNIVLQQTPHKTHIRAGNKQAVNDHDNDI